jgi:hypothetical protein
MGQITGAAAHRPGVVQDYYVPALLITGDTVPPIWCELVFLDGSIFHIDPSSQCLELDEYPSMLRWVAVWI